MKPLAPKQKSAGGDAGAYVERKIASRAQLVTSCRAFSAKAVER